MKPPMPMRLWTQRDQGEKDPYGNVTPDWQAHLSDQPCYWWEASGDEAVSESREVTVGDEAAIVAHSIDVKEGDRVVKVVDHKSRVVFDIATGDVFREVDNVVNHRDFFELTLMRAG